MNIAPRVPSHPSLPPPPPALQRTSHDGIETVLAENDDARPDSYSFLPSVNYDCFADVICSFCSGYYSKYDNQNEGRFCVR